MNTNRTTAASTAAFPSTPLLSAASGSQPAFTGSFASAAAGGQPSAGAGKSVLGPSGGQSAYAAGLTAPQRAMPWKDDHATDHCDRCGEKFTFYRRRHHCRRCGGLYCDKCASHRITGIAGYGSEPQRICEICRATAAVTGELTQIAMKPRSRRIVLLGLSGVGKSTFVQVLGRNAASEGANLVPLTGPADQQYARVAGAASAAGAMPTDDSGSMRGLGGMSRAGLGADSGGATTAAASSALSSSSYYYTMQRKFRAKNGDRYDVSVIDTAGQSACDLFQPNYAIGVCAFVLMFSVDDRSSFDILGPIRDRLLDCGCFDTPLFVVANKVDLVNSHHVAGGVGGGSASGHALGTASLGARGDGTSSSAGGGGGMPLCTMYYCNTSLSSGGATGSHYAPPAVTSQSAGATASSHTALGGSSGSVPTVSGTSRRGGAGMADLGGQGIQGGSQLSQGGLLRAVGLREAEVIASEWGATAYLEISAQRPDMVEESFLRIMTDVVKHEASPLPTSAF